VPRSANCLGEGAGFEWASGAFIVETELEQPVVTLHDLSEQPANSRIIPVEIPGLFDAKSGLLP
jgi:hypothetical protein